MEEIVKRLKELNGLHEPEDFANQSSEYVEPVHAGYRGYDLYECPPNGQGITALVILRILEGFELANGKYGEADRIHLLAEATKAGYALRDAVVSDPAHGSVPFAELLSDALADRLRPEVRLPRASAPERKRVWEGKGGAGR